MSALPPAIPAASSLTAVAAAVGYLARAARADGRGVRSPMPTAAGPPVEPRVLVGECERRLYVLQPVRIEYIEACGNYVTFHCGGAEYLSRDSIKRLAAELADRGFVRIERSLVINVRAIRYAQRTGRGTYAFTLLSGSCVHSGPRYRDEILRVLPLDAHAQSR